MTETLHDPGPAAAPPPDQRRLVRDPDDKVVAGVCAAFGRYTDTDPVLWRVTVAVLAVFGGAGLALYALGWLLVPRAGEPQSVVERLLRRPDRGVTVAGVLLLVVIAVVLLGLLDSGPGPLPLLVVAGIAYLVARERRETTPVPYGPVPYGPVPPPGGPPPGAHAPPPPPRERSPLGSLTLSAAALVAGVLLAVGAAGADGITADRVLAALLLVVGAGLVVGAWWGRARWLIGVAAALALLLAPVAALEDAPGSLGAGVGERTWVPGPADDRRSYELGAGEATLDLSRLRGSTDRDVRAELGAGSLVVLVPADLTVRVAADVRLGDIALVELDGSRTDLAVGDDTRLREQFVVGDGDPDVELDLRVGMGEIEVRRVQA